MGKTALLWFIRVKCELTQPGADVVNDSIVFYARMNNHTDQSIVSLNKLVCLTRCEKLRKSQGRKVV